MIMPKVTYPRSCPNGGNHFKSRHFFEHKKRCGTTEHRVHYLFCPLTFAFNYDMERHVRQQHSNNPFRFPCTICGTELTRAENLRLHMETIHADQKPYYRCWYSNATFTWKISRQRHMRRVHGRIFGAQEVNLQLHLQHLSEEDDFKNEWVFVESSPIEQGEHNICPCGQTPIQEYFFLENKFNGNRTIVGSDCKAAAVKYYFKHILENEVQGIYKGQDNKGLETFTVKEATTLVQRLPIVEH